MEDTNIVGGDVVMKDDIVVAVDVGSVNKHLDDTFVGDKFVFILDDTPVVPRRIQKLVAVCESPYVSKFASGCSNLQGQPVKYIEKVHSSKYIFSLKHLFSISIIESFLDLKLLYVSNNFVDKSLRVNLKYVFCL